MADVVQELRFAGRRLARAPLFTAITVLTLAVGIGANSAIFSVVNGVLLKPLPYERPEELVSIWHTAPGLQSAGRRLPMSQAVYFTYRAENRVFEDLGIADEGSVTITGGATPERVTSLLVTDGTLSLLGVRPLLGRRFIRSDDAPGSPATVILGYGYWQRRFGGDRRILGQNLIIDGSPFEIIGVLPQGFRVLEHDPAVYLPARFDPAQAQTMSFRYRAIGRLRRGFGIAQANADLSRLIPVAVERYAGPLSLEQLRQMGFAPSVRPLKQDLVGDVSTVLWVLLGTVGLVLLLGCANVVNLFLVRAEVRQREVAVRTALGAGPGRIVASFVTESLLLGGLAGLFGLVLAYGGLQLLTTLGPQSLPRMDEITMDVRVLGFTAAVSLLVGILFGPLSALRYRRPDLHESLKEGARTAGVGPLQYRARNGLVVVQVALALVLLIGSGLMVRSVQSLREVDPGFRRPDQVLTFGLFIPEAEIAELDRLAQIERQILDQVGEVPGVMQVGGSWSMPMTSPGMNAPIQVEGAPVEPGRIPTPRRHTFITPGYAETLLDPLIAGRTLTWADIEERAKVVLISENLAREYWGAPAAAIGNRIQLEMSPGWYEIIGVLGNLRDDGLTQEPPTMVFWPLAVEFFRGEAIRSLSVAVRANDPDALLPAIQRAVWSVNPNLPLATVQTLREILDASMARAAFAMVMLSIAAGVALVLDLVGIYGVISYVVSQRTREIGVRIALGARPGAVGRMVVGQAAAVTGAGVMIGLGAAVGLTRLMAGLLHGVRPVDPLTYGGVALVIATVALAASYLPARRAARIDPVAALRSE